MDEESPTVRLARRLAAWGVPGGGSAPRLEGAGCAGLVTRIGDDRLTGLAVAAAERGDLTLTAEQADGLLRVHHEAMTRALDHERTLLVVTEALESAGVDPVVLKGPAFAHTFYPDPSQRPFGDLDLLVRTRDWRRACAVLAELGYERAQPEPREGFDERFGKAATHRNRRGVAVDLHRTLVVGPFGQWIRPDELFDHLVPLELAGRGFRRLDAPTSFVHACLHASLGQWPMELLAVRDVAQIAGRGPQWGQVERLTDRWHLTAVVAHALDTAATTLAWEPPPAARGLRAARASRRERWALASYHGSARRGGGPGLAVLAALPGLRAKAAYLRTLLFPDRRFLDARTDGEEPASYGRRWWGALRRLVDSLLRRA